ncbi:TetR/AcrR family transcriptional regulator [Microlunatus elymi]|uniref:TetR/AcrR family transcriptional regulator n=1 Tax=Microlunatus elymi TaxID=2596828 RepID=A0A516Q126_9ACTN|nr:TetR/AcrR family transcriptional regulator [Microlunatus elymi]QDP97130.1 TetR/AcrR family transcriptional regulator [Microlunatus elymi]
MPTGVALQDPRQQLFGAAEQILLRQGPAALTSRAVTAEAGVAKGVLHRHFADFDDFLTELVRDRIARLAEHADDLQRSVGSGSVTDNLVRAVTAWFDPVALAIVALVTSRDELRSRLRQTTPVGLPLLTEAGTKLISYLSAEQQHGRLRADADVRLLALSIIGTVHLLFAGELGASPDPAAVREVIASIIVGAEAGA